MEIFFGIGVSIGILTLIGAILKNNYDKSLEVNKLLSSRFENLDLNIINITSDSAIKSLKAYKNILYFKKDALKNKTVLEELIKVDDLEKK